MLLALVVAGVLVVPVALAMACGPQAGVFPNQPTYAPGEGGTFTGVNFTPGLSFTIDIEGGPSLASVTVPSSGSFTVAFTAPSTAGTYVVAAYGTDESGNQLRSSPATITVAAPQVAQPSTAAAPAEAPAPAPAGAPASAAAPTPAASAPATAAPATKPAARRPAKRPAATAGPSRAQRPAARTRRPAVTAPAAAQPATQPAPTVFAGSVPRRSSNAATARKSTAASPRPQTAVAPKATVPSESSAQSAAWSGLGTSREPALVPTGSFPASGTSANGTARTLSILMLSLGLAALVGGVGVSEVRARRSRRR